MIFKLKRVIALLLLLAVAMAKKHSGDKMSTMTTERTHVTEEPPLAEDEMHTESPKLAAKNITCQMTAALITMSKSIKHLNDDIRAIKNQMFEKCPGFLANDTGMGGSSESVKNGTATDETELEPQSAEDTATTTAIPPIPTECDEPFKLVASSCYYILDSQSDWKSWGQANTFCQSLNGTLAAPYRVADLRTHLLENYSLLVFWVGAKAADANVNTFKWLTGKELSEDDWKHGQPNTKAKKECVYMESSSGYRAANRYCGEKFAFICEKRE